MSKRLKGFLISEATTIPEKPVIVSSNNKSFIIKTTLQDGDTPNRNKRVYPTAVIKKGLEAEYVQERIATKGWFGEAGHPLKPDLQRQLYLDQDRISHRINEIWWENNKLKGFVEATPTKNGKEFRGLIESGMKAAFSLRAVGPVTEKRGDLIIVLSPVTIFTYDWIIHPSHACAYMDEVVMNTGNMNESADLFMPFNEDCDMDIPGFLRDNSKNLKMFSESLGISTDDLTLSEDLRLIYAKQKDGDTFAIFTEEAIQQELNHFTSNLFTSKFF